MASGQVTSEEAVSAVTPAQALRWLTLLIIKSTTYFSVQLDGFVSSTVPSSSINEYSTPKQTSLACTLARAMFTMRHPLLPFDDNSKKLREEELLDKRLISPSIPGLAFSACAAALPLLKVRDPRICENVLELFNASLPYVFEPTLRDKSGHISIQDFNHEDKKRLQHFFRRIEQVCHFFILCI